MTDKITGTENDFKADSVEEWEERVFRHAAYFTVWRRNEEQRIFPSFRQAVADAMTDRRALVYAVTGTGRSVCLIRKRWDHYLTLHQQKSK